MRGPKTVKSIVNEKNRLNSVLDQARYYQRASQSLRSVLPPKLASKTSIVKVQGKQLLLVVPASEWASRLRVHESSLLKKAQFIFKKELNQLRIRVVRNDSLVSHTKPHKRALSLPARNSLRAASQSIKDPALSRLFEKFSKS
ncbi:MAG: DciA family protein [bacterium]